MVRILEALLQAPRPPGLTNTELLDRLTEPLANDVERMALAVMGYVGEVFTAGGAHVDVVRDVNPHAPRH